MSTPFRKYIYKIRAGYTTSSTHSFKTAGLNGEFDFVWISDTHIYTDSSSPERYQYLNQIMSYIKQNAEPYFFYSTGDQVSNGGRYYTWQTYEKNTDVFENYVFAGALGNHDAYINASVGQIADDPAMYVKTVFNTPNNGPDEKTHSYWFIYNSILFISLDSINASTSSSVIKAQKEWFVNVVEANKGKYQYLIVGQHYPFCNALTGGLVGPYGTNMDTWYALFDEYDVDIALSGDHHFYYRTKPLIAKQIATEEKTGTVYISAPQVGKRDRGMTDNQNPEYYDFRSDDNNSNDGTSGLTYFKVTPQGITGTLINQNGTVIDTYTIPAKRGIVYEDKKDEIATSFDFTSSKNQKSILMNPLLSPYIKSLKIYNGSSLLKTCDMKTNTNIFNLDNLEDNRIYNLKIVIEFADGDTRSANVVASTHPYHGNIYGLRVIKEGNQYNLVWNAELKNDIIKKYNILVDANLLTTIDNNQTKYQLNNFNINSSFTLQALDKDNNVITQLNTYYSVFGDYNLDNNVNTDDVILLLENIRNEHEFLKNEIRLLDQNGDSLINIVDATMMYQFLCNERKLHKDKYIVIFLDENGNILAKQELEYGSDAVIPSISDSNFDHWSASNKFITKDTIIMAVGK